MDQREIPLGFSMALAQNEAAVNAYAVMTKAQKQAVLAKARSAGSQEQMQQLISALAQDQTDRDG